MLGFRVGYWLVAFSLLGCGKSSNTDDPSAGGTSNTQGSTGGAPAGGASGSSVVGGVAGDTSSSATYFEPGSRLKPQVLAAADGLEIIESQNGGWYDSELDFDCVFFPDEGGVERCFPRALVPGPLLFADAACQRPVLATSGGGSCPGPRSQYVVLHRGCVYRGAQLGAELPPSAPLFFSEDGSSCEPTEHTPELAPIYELEAVPPETFVGMRRSARPRAPGLDAYIREGDDGSWQIMGYFDAAREAACFDGPFASNQQPKCFPTYAGTSELFVDSDCQARLSDAQLRACEVEQPTAIIESQADASVCPIAYDVQLYDIDDIRETTRHQIDASGACVAVPGLPTESYARGAAIDLATLPTLETLVVGTGAVRVLFSGFGGIPYMPRQTGTLRDESNGQCLPFHFPDGSLRCVPTSFPTTLPSAFLYEDASCSGAPVMPWNSTGACPADGPLPRAVLIPDQTTKCLQQLALSEVLSVIGESDESAFYAKDIMTGACQSAKATSPTPTYLRLGAALKASEFGKLERTTRL
jgi:hypothetical protein